MPAEKTTKKTGLNFLEQIVLLAIDDKGWFGNTEHTIKFGLASAILFELFTLKRIEYKNSKIQILNPDPTKEPVLDKVLDVLKSAKKPWGVRGTIKKIVYKKLGIRKAAIQSLLDKKIVRKEEYSLLWIMYQNKFPLVNGNLKHDLREKIYNLILSEKPLDSSTFMMMVIMHNCNMLRKNFKDFEHYKRFHLRVKDILESKESTD
ncbi:MAG: GPP34 family phosphoprotein, partial [Bacteroidota bacterium]|nr:GPP34 family phosphoprotein [Bacteroidota bacterium]